MKTILFLVADGFEEMELAAPFDLLQRGGVGVTLASIGGDLSVRGSHGLQIQADVLLKDVQAEDYDGVFLPGGGRGVKNLCACPGVATCALAFAAAGKWVAAICAGPKVLALAGLTKGRRVTSYPSVADEIRPLCKEYVEDRVCVDGRLITSRGAGTAEEFALTFLRELTDPEVSAVIRGKILAR
jgi:4-methyl-5(b-hydroxyethyl)-thiazole monophosphate biosynthesis